MQILKVTVASFKVVSLRDTSLAARQLLEVGAAVLVVVLVQVVLAGEITSSFLTPSNPVPVHRTSSLLKGRLVQSLKLRTVLFLR